MIFFGIFVLFGSIALILAVRGNWFALGSDEAKKVIPQFYNQSLEVSLGSRKLTVTPMAGNAVKVVQKDVRYIYEGAYKNTDVVQSVYPYKIKEELIFWGKGHPVEFKYKLGNLETFIVKKDEKGNIKFYDKETYEKTGELSKIFTIPAPFVEDKVGERSFVDVESIIQGDLLVITVNSDWIAQAVYPVILDPTIEINVLNVYSHPSQGQNWEVEFVTKGKADLKIIPQDQATIDDDEFIGLYCDQNIHEPIILTGDIIYYQNWECSGIGKVIHKTLKAGHHTLKFEFAGAEGYAEDWAYNESWLSGWDKRIRLAVSTTNIDEDLTHFPLMLELGTSVGTNNDDVSSIFDELTSDANRYKIAVTKDDGTTEIYVEIEKWDDANETAILWVSSSSLVLSGSADTTLYLYYDKDHADNTTYVGDINSAAAENVWDSYYMAVYHMANTSWHDSTANDNDGSSNGNVTTTTSGKVGNGASFPDGTNDWIQVTDDDTLSPGQKLTISGWYYDTQNDTRARGMVSKRTSATKDQEYSIFKWTSSRTFFDSPNSGDRDDDATAQSTATWFQSTQVFDGSLSSGRKKFYTNQNLIRTQESTHTTLANTSSALHIGILNANYGYCWKGTIDEVRLSNTARSAAWIKADYYSTTDGLVDWESEESVPSDPEMIRIKGNTRIKGGTRLNLEDSQQKI